MKAATIFHLVLGLFIIPFLVFCLAIPPRLAQAQDSGYLDPSEKFSREQLAQMLAPIALYPDVLLSQVLMASTYPIEVIEADRWIRQNPDLKGEALDSTLLGKDWDPSVKAICHFRSILTLMSERITETTNLGNAFLAQEAEVMETVQQLRAKAHAQGNLATNSEQKVIVEKETIVIEPADPGIIYVPYYDPFYIYGPWWYSAFPPYYWYPSGISIGVGISYWPGVYFGFAFGTWSYFDWHHRYIYIDVLRRPRFVRYKQWRPEPGRWHHAPRHRRGVAYRDKATARKYGQYTIRSRDFGRDTRGFPEREDRGRSIDNRIRIDREIHRNELTTIERDRQLRERLEREKKERVRTDRLTQERQSTDRVKQERERVERERQMRQQTDQTKRKREGVEREHQRRSRDNIFNRVEEGRRERQSSERGRASRKALGNDDRSHDRR